ncbi:MAG: hypothetical protein ACOX6T_09230 [Myxococcales bacterium]|jgi:hypothetical protein
MTRRIAAVCMAICFAACSGDEGTPDAGNTGKHDSGQADSGEIILPPDDGGVSKPDGSVQDGGEKPEIAWCNIQAPAQASIKVGSVVAVYGQVYVPGVTEAQGQGAAVVGQLGFGPAGSDPRSASGWLWGAAAYHKDVGNHDEYEGKLSPNQPGAYSYAFKFRIGDSAEVYCDTDGGEFSPGAAGALEVRAAGVDWCNLQFPPSSTIEAGGKLTAYGRVFLEGVTEQEGPGTGIEAELGVGPAGTNGSTSGAWSWTGASFNVDVGNDDEFVGEASPGIGSYSYAFRFRHNQGAWLYCDLDGNGGSAGTYDPAQQGTLSVAETKPPVVDWCRLQFPSSAVITTGASLPVYGQVLVSGVTNAQGPGVGVVGEVGFGAAGTNGASDGSWTWTNAAFNVDVGDNDEFVGQVSPPAEGAYAYAFRFKYQGGDWLYCDLDANNGAPNGYDVAQQGALTVEATKPPAVDWCRLQIVPGSSPMTEGEAFTAFGQVYIAGVTHEAGQGAGVEGELGYGLPGTDGSTSTDWTWIAAAYNLDVDFANDEYMATFNPVAGSYSYAFRFRYNGGDWLYCDTDGNTGAPGGFDPALQGSLQVDPPALPVVDFCNLQWPPSGTVTVGQSFDVYGQVYKAGVTNQPGASPDIESELGYGPANTNGSTDSAWTWLDASFNEDKGANDEYMAQLALAEGAYAYAYRFRYQGGEWTYCDLDGSNNGFDPAQQGSLTVQSAPPPTVGWCRLQVVPGSETMEEGGRFTSYGQVFVDGVTNQAGRGDGVEGELGLGPAGTDGSSASGWSWTAAVYNVDVDGANDEYMAEIVPEAGSYSYAFRFRYNGGPWLYCDSDGNDGAQNLFDPAKQGSLTVTEAAAPWVELRPLASGVENAGASFFVTAEVYLRGVTDAAGQGSGISASVGVGPAGTPPTGNDWQWSAADYVGDAAGGGSNANDVYGGWAVAAAAGSAGYDVAMRFTISGVDYYADLDGDTAYDSSEAGKLVTFDEPEVGDNDIGWCNLQFPETATSTAGQPSPLIYGRVYMAGETEPAGCSGTIVSQLGWGPAGSDPRTARWHWADAPCNPSPIDPGSNDEHQGSITAPAAGTYSYAYRVRWQRGWTYCDLDGSHGRSELDLGQLGTLTVTE